MEERKRIEITDLLVWLLGLTFLTLLVVKAARAGFTHDESITYHFYLHSDWMSILNTTPVDTNNHILNTLLMKVMVLCGLESEWALRVPSLLGAAVFMWFSWRIAKSFGKAWLVPIGFLLLTTNLYVFDFLGMARGYGLMIACITASSYFFLRWTEKGQSGFFRRALIWGILSVFANFNAIPFLFLLVFFHNVMRWIDLRFDEPTEHAGFWRHNAFTLITFVVSGVLLYEPLRKILKGGRLYFGADNGFWPDTVGSLTNSSLYSAPWSDALRPIVPWVVLALAGIALMLALVVFWPGMKSTWARRKKLFFSVSLLWMLVLWAVAQHVVLGTLYQVDRTALTFVFVFLLTVVALLDQLSGYFPVPGIAVGAVLALAVTFHFSWNFNDSHFRDWYYEQDLKAAYALVEERTPPGETANLGVSWIISPTTNYYRRAHEMQFLPETNKQDGPLPTDELWLITGEDLNLVTFTEEDVIEYWPASNTWLIENNN